MNKLVFLPVVFAAKKDVGVNVDVRVNAGAPNGNVADPRCNIRACEVEKGMCAPDWIQQHNKECRSSEPFLHSCDRYNDCVTFSTECPGARCVHDLPYEPTGKAGVIKVLDVTRMKTMLAKNERSLLDMVMGSEKSGDMSLRKGASAWRGPRIMVAGHYVGHYVGRQIQR